MSNWEAAAFSDIPKGPFVLLFHGNCIYPTWDRNFGGFIAPAVTNGPRCDREGHRGWGRGTKILSLRAPHSLSLINGHFWFPLFSLGPVCVCALSTFSIERYLELIKKRGLEFLEAGGGMGRRHEKSPNNESPDEKSPNVESPKF